MRRTITTNRALSWLLRMILVCGTTTAIHSQSFISDQLTSGTGKWRTLSTAHFDIHYPTPRGDFARRFAAIAERVHAALDPRYRSGVTRTQVALVFDTDIMNAYANVWGRDQVVLFLNNPQVGPEGTSGWSRYDLWVEELFTHEYTHILSLRYMGSLSSDPYRYIFRYLFGIPPNIISPEGFTEGTAVYEESRTGRGRNNDPVTEMILRTAVLENRLPDSAEVMNGSHRWPGGSIYYLYGGQLMRYIAERYGEDSLVRFWHDPENFLDLDSRLHRAGMPGYIYLYRSFREELEKRYYEQAFSLRSTGLTPLERLTFDGSYKAFLVLDNKGRPSYYFSPTDRIPGIYRWEGKKRERRIRMVESSSGIAFSDGREVFSEDYFFYPTWGLRYELYGRGKGFFMRRILPGVRALFPSLSRDGNTLYYIERSPAGNKELKKVTFDAKDRPASPSVLLRVPFTGILQYTALSPDGSRIAVLARRGERGYGDLLLCDTNQPLQTGSEGGRGQPESPGGGCRVLVPGRAALLHPAFSQDGTRLYFSSDPDRVFDLYSVELKSGSVRRETRNVTGLFYPAPANGSLYALAYYGKGYDLVRISDDRLLHEPVDFFSRPQAPEPDENTLPVSEENSAWTDSAYRGPFAIQPFLLGLFNAGYLPGESILNLGIMARDPLDRHLITAIAGATMTGTEGYAEYDYTRYATGLTISYFSNYWRGARSKECLWNNSDPVTKDLLCEKRNPKLENGDAYVSYSSRGRYIDVLIEPGGVFRRMRNADELTSVRYTAKDLNLGGPAFILMAGKSHLYPESISPEQGWRLSLSGEDYVPGASSLSRGGANFERIEYGYVEGQLSLYLPSFFSHHVNYLSLFGHGTVGPDRTTERSTLARFERGINADDSTDGTNVALMTYEYRLPLYWFSRSFLGRYPEYMFRETALTLFYERGAAFDTRPLPGEWTDAMGFTFAAGISLFYIPMPLQFFVTVARGTGDAGEIQVVFGISAGELPPVAGRGDSLFGSGHPQGIAGGGPLGYRRATSLLRNSVLSPVHSD